MIPLKYISAFFRSVEITFINSKLHLELSWREKCIMSNVVGDSTFQITKTELHVPVVLL